MRDNDRLPPPQLAPSSLLDAYNAPASGTALIDRIGVGWCIGTLDPTLLNDPLQSFVERFYQHKEALLRNKTGVYVYGNHSIGKSYATAMLCKALASAGYSCLWITINQLIDCYIRRDDYLFDGRPLWERVLSVHFLFVDDLGKETNNTNIAQMCERMLRERLQNSGQYSATVITSNIPFPTEEHKQMLYRYGEGMTTLIQRTCLSRKVDGVMKRRDNVQNLAAEIA